MFVFSVLSISIVGLFVQIVSAMTAYFLSQQYSLGEQMLKWHSLAFAYSCTATGAPEVAGNTVTLADIAAETTLASRATELAGSYQWNSVYFSGTYNGVAASRLLVTYVTPTERPSGYASLDVGRQLAKVTMRQSYRFGLSTAAQNVTFTTYDGGPQAITIGGLPAAVVPNSAVLVSDARCN